jgi:hypothetical protein
MARSIFSVLRSGLSPSRRRLAEAAENAKTQLFAQHLTDVLGQMREQERQLLDNSAQRLAEE